MFLVGIGYVLLVAGPLLSGRLAPLLAEGAASSAGALPTAASAGIALLGAAAMVLVLAQLVRDVERHPYGAIAPVLAVFSAYLLTSARAQLPMPAWAGEHVGLFVLTLALLGGALIARAPLVARLFGWALATLPFGACAAVVIANREGDPLQAIARLDGSVQTYLTLLGLSTFALAFAGAISRSLVRAAVDTDAAATMPPLRLSEPGYASDPQPAPQPAPRITIQPMRAPLALDRRPPRAVPHVPRMQAPAARAPQRSPLGEPPIDASFDEDVAIQLMKRKSSGRTLWIALSAIAVLALGGYLAQRAPTIRVATPVELKAAPLAPSAPAAEPQRTPAITTEQLREASPSSPQVEPTPIVPPTPTLAQQPVRTASDARAERRAARAEKRRRAAEAKASEAEKAKEAASTAPKAARHAARMAVAESAAASRGGQPAPEKASPPSALEAPRAAAKASEPASAVEPTKNGSDLDLDQLVHKALKNTQGVRAEDDPLLGL